MLDLTPLTTMLAGLGPWGVLIGVVLTMALNFYRTKQVLPSSAPSTPAPAPVQPVSPDPTPLLPTLPVIPGNRPLLTLGLQLLPLLVQKRTAVAALPPSGAPDTVDVLEEQVLKQIAAIATK